MNPSNQSLVVKLDGRHQRGERNRQAIIDAALALIAEGCLAPTAQLVSERAGITIRSLFRHFPDMESLFVSADTEVRRRAVGTFSGGDHEGSLEQRVQHAVQRYCEGYSLERNVFLMVKAQTWRSPVLRDNYARLREELRHTLEDWVPEIRGLDPAPRELVHAMTSFEMWHRLHELQGVGQAEVIAIMADDLLVRLNS